MSDLTHTPLLVELIPSHTIEAIEKAILEAEANLRPYERIEITFDRLAVQLLGQLLREVTKITHYHGLPVEFPECPAPAPDDAYPVMHIRLLRHEYPIHAAEGFIHLPTSYIEELHERATR